MFLVKNIGYVLLYSLFYDGSAFQLFDAQILLEKASIVNLTAEQLKGVLNIDIGGEYTTLKFQYNNDQNMGLYDDPRNRCNADHVRCLTSILAAARPVCVITDDGKVGGMANLCDAHLSNCRLKQAYWRIIDSGNCTRAKIINVYDYAPGTFKIENMPG